MDPRAPVAPRIQAKEVRSLANLTAGWRERAAERLGAEPTGWSQSVIGREGDVLTADDVPLAAIGAIGAEVVAAVSVKRAVWTHWNLMAEAAKQTMDLIFATTEDREAVVGLIVDAAQARSVVLTPPELARSPARFQREDGTSRFRPRHGEKYSSIAVLGAEGRLLARAEKVTALAVSAGAAGRAGGPGTVSLTAQQRRAVESICGSGLQVDLLVGPAGAGKTTTMRALHTAWISEHGRGSVVGLAPSAAAAQALANNLGVGCENTAKWLHEYDRGGVELRRGQLVIVARPPSRTPGHWIGSPGSRLPRTPRCSLWAIRTSSSPSMQAVPSRS